MIYRLDIRLSNKNSETKTISKEYLTLLFSFVSDPYVDYYGSSGLKLFLLWQILQTVLSMISVDIVSYNSYKEYNKNYDIIKFLEFFKVGEFPLKDSICNWSEFFLLGIILYVRIINKKHSSKTVANFNEGIKSTKKYDDNNIFDIKLRDYCIINFSNYKMEMSEQFRKITDTKIPAAMTIFCGMYNSSESNLFVYKNNRFDDLFHKLVQVFQLYKLSYSICDNFVQK